MSKELRAELHRRKLLGPPELAEICGVPIATIYAWRTKNYGPVGMRIGKHVRYAPEAVDAWLAEQREAAS